MSRNTDMFSTKPPTEHVDIISTLLALIDGLRRVRMNAARTSVEMMKPLVANSDVTADAAAGKDHWSMKSTNRGLPAISWPSYKTCRNSEPGVAGAV